ncbi:hypothetical protein QYF61_008536 [Mycteria americana]|uniref:Uncharacterized protein n=1 Tax=Mycteria americana TaxID=33587 RepID=A0AAN7NTA5_MYCAM|nr:hypothetical protein QYF61_008536 [Mycteria americana]
MNLSKANHPTSALYQAGVPTSHVNMVLCRTQEQEIEVCNTDFSCVMNLKLPRSSRPLCLERQVRETQVMDLLRNLNPCKSMGPNWVDLKVLRKLDDVIVGPVSSCLKSRLGVFMVTGERQILHLPSKRMRRTIQCTTGHPWENQGEVIHFWAYEGEEGDWEQSAWIYQGQIKSEQSDYVLLWKD